MGWFSCPTQVGLNYGKVLECVKKAGITELVCLAEAGGEVEVHDQRFPRVGWKTVEVEEIERHGFWKASTP